MRNAIKNAVPSNRKPDSGGIVGMVAAALVTVATAILADPTLLTSAIINLAAATTFTEKLVIFIMAASTIYLAVTQGKQDG